MQFETTYDMSVRESINYFLNQWNNYADNEKEYICEELYSSIDGKVLHELFDLIADSSLLLEKYHEMKKKLLKKECEVLLHNLDKDFNSWRGVSLEIDEKVVEHE